MVESGPKDAPMVDEKSHRPDLGSSPLVEHYRIDDSRRLIGILACGSALLVVGTLVATLGLRAATPPSSGLSASAANTDALPAPTAISGLRHGRAVDSEGRPISRGSLWPDLRLGLSVLFVTLLAGAGTLWALQRELSEDGYLALRQDGALYRDGKRWEFVPWDQVRDIRYREEDDSVCFVRQDGSEWIRRERFAAIANKDLARAAKIVRDRALFGLLG